eukprot:TRINITY_DN2531_c4_g1_i1.p1 TRINITY_DN2531_c4_g1~~TRINITY_DN2531_c4_g1_i1.p1  ORF type:complete len:253 (+),score=28.63 TRINITY_DN2531_c4_g1_i1:54-812(+)
MTRAERLRILENLEQENNDLRGLVVELIQSRTGTEDSQDVNPSHHHHHHRDIDISPNHQAPLEAPITAGENPLLNALHDMEDRERSIISESGYEFLLKLIECSKISRRKYVRLAVGVKKSTGEKVLPLGLGEVREEPGRVRVEVPFTTSDEVVIKNFKTAHLKFVSKAVVVPPARAAAPTKIEDSSVPPCYVPPPPVYLPAEAPIWETPRQYSPPTYVGASPTPSVSSPASVLPGFGVVAVKSTVNDSAEAL